MVLALLEKAQNTARNDPDYTKENYLRMMEEKKKKKKKKNTKKGNDNNKNDKMDPDKGGGRGRGGGTERKRSNRTTEHKTNDSIKSEPLTMKAVDGSFILIPILNPKEFELNWDKPVFCKNGNVFHCTFRDKPYYIKVVDISKDENEEKRDLLHEYDVIHKLKQAGFKYVTSEALLLCNEAKIQLYLLTSDCGQRLDLLKLTAKWREN